ncbi:unnamed protein product [Orchesella dallaii]|uniref:Uncharacterized protein n=1 Tax=Orchesella dallaii TaxID=48710 RepID=A0ABP1Q4B4_9HEXA
MTCCRGCIVKTDAFIAALLSVAVLGISSFVLISSVVTPTETSDTSSDTKPDSISGNTASYILPPHNSTNQSLLDSTTEEGSSWISPGERNLSTNSTSTPTSPLPPNQSFLPTTTRNGRETESTSTTPKPTSSSSWNVFLHHEFWKGKSDTYIMLMQGSSGTGIFAAILQLGFSWLLICGSTKDLKDRTKLWNLSSFIVLILVVVIILVPLSYNSGTNQFKGASAFGRQVWRRIKSVPQQFSVGTLNIIVDSFSNFLVTDIALFYYVMGVDAFILMCFLILPFLCCIFYPCRKCCCKKKKEKTDSDLLLFGNSGDTF